MKCSENIFICFISAELEQKIRVHFLSSVPINDDFIFLGKKLHVNIGKQRLTYNNSNN